MIRAKIPILVIALQTMVVTTLLAGDLSLFVETIEAGNKTYEAKHLRFQGEITSIDISKFSRIVTEQLKIRKASDSRMNAFGGAGLMVYLNSKGGDILAAMEIGRMLRKENVYTVIAYDGECSSACIFLLASGVNRLVQGLHPQIGLHRPRFEQKLFAKLNATEARDLYNKLIDKCREYLREMGISQKLMDDMLAVPSQEIDYRDFQYAGTVLLNEEDAAFAEWKRAKRIELDGEAKVLESERRSKQFGECYRGDDSACTPKMLKERNEDFEKLRKLSN